MAKQNINVGTAANDKKGDSLRAAFQKVNANFTELYTSLGLINDVTLNLGAFEFAGSVMSTTDSTAIVIDQATTVTSNLSVGGNILPQTANGGDLGSSTLPWRSLYVSNNTIFIGGTAVGVDANGALTTGGTVVGSTPAWANITGKPTFATVATTGAYADLTGKPTLFSGSYNDLTNKPNLAGTYQFSVAADDSTQRVISTDEVIKFIGAGGITTASDAEGNITINYVQGDIRSEGNINIEINLSDSTKRIWQFGEDGALTFPDGTTQATAYTGGGGGGTGTLTLLNNQIYPSVDNGGSVGTSSRRFNEGWFVNAVYVGNFGAEALSQIDGGRIFLTNTGFQDPVKLFLNNVEFGNNSTGLRQGLVITENIDGTIYTYLRANNVSKKVDFPNGLTGHLAGTTENIESENDVSIRVNLSDSTTRIWRFGEDGDTVFPNNVSINYSGNNVQFPRIIADSGKAFSVQGQGASGSAAMSWTVDPDAAGQYAAVSVSRAGGDNLAKVVLQAQSDSGNAATVKLWKFDETGTLTLPKASKISEVIPGTGAAANVIVIQSASSILNTSFATLPPAPISNYAVPGTDIVVNVTWNTNGEDYHSPRFEVVNGGTGHTGGGQFSGGEVLTVPYVDMGISGGGDWTWYVSDLASDAVLAAGLNEWTFGGDGTLTFPDATVQTTALVQGEQIFTLDTGAIDYTPTVVDFNLLFVTPAIGYSETDPTSVTLPAGVPGQRLVIFNGYNLATLTVNPGPVGRDISSGVIAEFIYSGFDGLWIPLYGTNSPT